MSDDELSNSLASWVPPWQRPAAPAVPEDAESSPAELADPGSESVPGDSAEGAEASPRPDDFAFDEHDGYEADPSEFATPVAESAADGAGDEEDREPEPSPGRPYWEQYGAGEALSARSYGDQRAASESGHVEAAESASPDPVLVNSDLVDAEPGVPDLSESGLAELGSPDGGSMDGGSMDGGFMDGDPAVPDQVDTEWAEREPAGAEPSGSESADGEPPHAAFGDAESGELAHELADAVAEHEPGQVSEFEAAIANWTGPASRRETVIDDTAAAISTEPGAFDAEPAVLDTEPSAVDTEPAVVDLAPAVVDVEPVALDVEPGVVDVESGVVDVEPVVLDAEPGVVDVESVALDVESVALDVEPGAVDAESVAIDVEPEVVDVESWAADSEPVAFAAVAGSALLDGPVALDGPGTDVRAESAAGGGTPADFAEGDGSADAAFPVTMIGEVAEGLAPEGAGAGEAGAAPADLRGALEAILLVVDEPVAEELLADVLSAPVADVTAQLAALAAEYTEQHRGFELRRAAGGWRLYTRGEFAPYVEKFVLDGQSVRLTQAALETLAVIAYHQPVTRSRMSAIRGVNCDGVVRTLVSRGLIEECGTQPESGAFLYRTTAVFLEKLGLDSLEELPSLAPFLPDDVNGLADAQR